MVKIINSADEALGLFRSAGFEAMNPAEASQRALSYSACHPCERHFIRKRRQI